MNKLLISLGSIATTLASTAFAVSCGASEIPPVPNNEGGDDSLNSKEVNRILTEQASKISLKEDTDHDFLRVGGKDLHTWNNGIVKLEKEGGGDWKHAFAELRPGDYIDFVFDDPSDIKNFTDRVFYDNTLADKNISAGASMASIYFNKFIVKNGEVVGTPEETGIFQSEGVAGDKSIFGLKAIKENVIRMTIKDFFEKDNQHLDAQIIYLRGFSDVNGDGRIDLKDEQMTPPFAIDRTVMYQNYWDPYKASGKQYWFKDWTVGVHQQEIIDYINKL